jgi:hypothetical protein
MKMLAEISRLLFLISKERRNRIKECLSVGNKLKVLVDRRAEIILLNLIWVMPAEG